MLLKDSLHILSTFLSRISIPHQMSKILEDIMTPQEIQEITERIRILKELKKGKTQRQIAQDLGISVTTVSRGARILKYGTGEITKYL